jgi:hypothetical protein
MYSHGGEYTYEYPGTAPKVYGKSDEDVKKYYDSQDASEAQVRFIHGAQPPHRAQAGSEQHEGEQDRGWDAKICGRA